MHEENDGDYDLQTWACAFINSIVCVCARACAFVNNIVCVCVCCTCVNMTEMVSYAIIERES